MLATPRALADLVRLMPCVDGRRRGEGRCWATRRNGAIECGQLSRSLADADIVRNMPVRSPITQKASPPSPVKCGYVTHKAAPIAIAASIALPPARNTSQPAALANA